MGDLHVSFCGVARILGGIFEALLTLSRVPVATEVSWFEKGFDDTRVVQSFMREVGSPVWLISRRQRVPLDAVGISKRGCSLCECNSPCSVSTADVGMM